MWKERKTGRGKGSKSCWPPDETFLVCRVCPTPMIYKSLHSISDSHDWDQSL